MDILGNVKINFINSHVTLARASLGGGFRGKETYVPLQFMSLTLSFYLSSNEFTHNISTSFL